MLRSSTLTFRRVLRSSASRGVRARAARPSALRRLGQQYLEARVGAQRLVATYFPFVALLGDVADALVLGVGAGLIASGHLSTGALIAFVLYIDLFFSPIQQLSQVFDSWQQTRVSVRRITELMSLDSLTPMAVDALGRPFARSPAARRRPFRVSLGRTPGRR